MYIDEFNQLIAEIVESDEFLQMRQYKHHINGTVYDHSIQVAYLCYKHYINHNSKVNLNELLRGALLHDYFLYNRHDKTQHINRFLHVFKHPKCALKNAETVYPDLTKTEIDMIKKHMFPLTVLPPTTRGGWLICFYDKLAAIKECCGLPMIQDRGINHMYNNYMKHAKLRLKRKYRSNISKINYWLKIEKKFARKKRWKVEEFQMTFPHDIFSSFVKDDELRIEAIASQYGYHIADERLLSHQSVYWFVKNKTIET